MKTILLILALMAGFPILGNASTEQNPTGNEVKDISVVTTPDLLELVTVWADEYSATRPDINIMVHPLADISDKERNLGFFTDDEMGEDFNMNDWKIVVGRDVVVPVINANNPMLELLTKYGMSRQHLVELLLNPNKETWYSLYGEGEKSIVNLYFVNDGFVENAVAEFLGSPVKNLITHTSGSEADFVKAIQADVHAIGFCRLNTVSDIANSTLLSGISLLPMDINQNGKLDKVENIYTGFESFNRGVWIGKFPKVLVKNIYSVARAGNLQEEEAGFVKWVIKRGNTSLLTDGYIALSNNEVSSKISRLNAVIATPRKPVNDGFNFNLLYLFGGLLLVFLIVFEIFYRRYRKQMNLVVDEPFVRPVAFTPERVDVPGGLYYDKTHMWAFREKEGNVRLGVDDFLQHITGTFTQVILKGEGESFKKGEPILTLIQKGKKITLNAPVSGTIVNSNKNLLFNADTINTSPFTEGWAYIIEPSNWNREIVFLKIAEKYKTWLNNEFIRLKEFIATCHGDVRAEPVPLVMQDGGELVDHVLSHLGPEAWVEFQTQYLDNSY